MSHASGARNDRSVAGRVMLYASAVLVAQCAGLLILIARYYWLHDPSAPLVGVDFTVFWSAAKVAIAHGAPAVYSPQWMGPLEATLRPPGTFAPWPYPPTFLLAVLPLGVMSFGAAFATFFAVCVAVYTAVIARLARGLNPAMVLALAAFPGVAVCIYSGQNSLLTAAAAGSALTLLASSPVLAGACIAVLAIKPQLGMLFPLALICGRHWKALIASGLGAAVFATISALMLGGAAWTSFASFLPEFNRVAVEHGSGVWRATPTVFAAARIAGLSVGAAYVAHALIAIPAVVATGYLWMVRARFELKAAALCLATLLAQPYLIYYDLAWLALPIVFLMRDGERASLSRAEWCVIALAWLLPAQGLFAVLAGFRFQIAPVFLVWFLVAVMLRHFSTTAHR